MRLHPISGLPSALVLLFVMVVSGCSLSPPPRMPADGASSGKTTAAQGKPEHKSVGKAIQSIPQTPEGIETISVPAVVIEAEASYIGRLQQMPSDIVLAEVPTPARVGPRPLSAWAGDQRDAGTGTEAAPKAPQSPASKTLMASFDSTDFDTNVTNTGGSMFIPPDPSAAAGESHLVNVVNVTVRFHQKDGTLDFDAALDDFFAAEAPLTDTFDPKVIYDQYEDRFVIVTLERTYIPRDPADTSRIMVAVSDDGDPNGTWYTTSWDSLVDISSVSTWADYPAYAIDQAAIYISTSMFAYSDGLFKGSRQWVVDKGVSGGFYAGSAATVLVFDLYTATSTPATWRSTTQPAHIFGTSPFSSGSGTYFTSYSGLSGGGIEYLYIMSLDDPLGAAVTGSQLFNLGDIENTSAGMPDAPQSGTSTLIETNDRRTLHSVWRDDSLWLTTTIVPNTGDPDAGQATAYWFELDTSSGMGSITLADQGSVGGEDIASGTYTSFPSIGVNRTGDVGIGFAASAPTIYAGAYYATRKADDAAGSTQGSELLRAGTDYYERFFPPEGTLNRWGDYTGLAVDPVTECFWAYNQYAMTRGTPTPSYPLDNGRWATAYGRFCSCTESLSLTASQWYLISLPCATNATVDDLFGDDGLGVYDTDWVVIERDEATDSYQELLLTDTLDQGAGYWITVTSGSHTIDVEGGTTERRSELDIPLAYTTDPGRWNMVGHPHTFSLAWSNVKVVDNGTSNEYLISDATSENYINNRTMFLWNGASYQSYHPVSNPGNLSTFDGFWVRVKADSTLRFPTSGAKSGLMSTKELIDGWYVQLTATSGTYSDPGNRLGRMTVSVDGADEYDLEELEPYASPYLTLVFPHPGWSDFWSYTTDFRELRDGAGGEWGFEIRSDVPREVELSWLGGLGFAEILSRSRLIDEETGTTIEPQAGGSYTVSMVSTTHQLTWQVNSLPIVNATTNQVLPASRLVSLAPAAVFIDEDTGDTHTATIDWGDGSGPQPGIVDQAAGTVSGSCLYSQDGTYTVEICVSDSFGSSTCDTLQVLPAEIFQDGFESSDATAWSKTVG